MRRKIFLQECPTRVSHKSVLQECHLDIYIVFQSCLHSDSWAPSCFPEVFLLGSSVKRVAMLAMLVGRALKQPAGVLVPRPRGGPASEPPDCGSLMERGARGARGRPGSVAASAWARSFWMGGLVLVCARNTNLRPILAALY